MSENLTVTYQQDTNATSDNFTSLPSFTWQRLELVNILKYASSSETRGRANIPSQSEHGSEKALLTIEYSAAKVFWRLFFPNGLGLILLVSILIDLYHKMILNGFNMKDSYILIVFSILAFSFLLLTIEMFMVKEIRFYKDRVEKEWTIFGTRGIEFSNAKIRGVSSWFVSIKNFLYIKKPKWYKYKCCGYDEHLVNEEDRIKAIKFLANISHRDVKDFSETRLEINPLIKNKG